MPEDATKNFAASLMIQNLARELFSVANEHGGKLPNRAVFFCDELGTMLPFGILPLFSAGSSRRLTLVPIIQTAPTVKPPMKPMPTVTINTEE